MKLWYLYSIIALLLLGSQRFLYKVSAEKGCNTAWTTSTFMATVTVLSSMLYLFTAEPLGDAGPLALISLWNSIAFLVATVSHIEALKHIPATIVYPIIRLNAAVIVIFSVLFFQETLSFFQVFGIVIALAVMILLAIEPGEKKQALGNKKKGLFLTFVALLAGAMAIVSSKFAAIHTHKLAFMAISYFLGTLFSLSLRNRLDVKGGESNRRDAIKIGLSMGLFNFAGFYCFLTALSLGPLSIIAPIMSMHFVIAIILSRLIYKENMGPLRILGILLTVVSVILLRL